VSSQVESGLQLTEHDPVQVTVHFEPSLQETLPLAPTVTSQVDPPPQSMLQEAPHSPVHSLFSLQSRLQLSPSHSLPERSQASSAGHWQLDPLQSGCATSSEPPQARTMRVQSELMRIGFEEARRMRRRSSTPRARCRLDANPR
jgi:hypothetical protein